MVSDDGVRWRRLQDALAPPVPGNVGPHPYEWGEDCDGSLSFPEGAGPVIMFGPACDGHAPPRKGARGRRDNAIVAVARPANVTDPYLTGWIKDPANPVAFAGKPCSFAGGVWKAPDGHYDMVCAVDGTWGRYSTADSTLHGPWALEDPHFTALQNGTGPSVGGKSGPSFLPLPDPGDGPTHIISDGAEAPLAFSFGRYDAARQKMVISDDGGLGNILDHGDLQWSAAGVSHMPHDGRVLSVGWVFPGTGAPADPRCPRVKGIAICGIQALSAVRIISYDAAVNRLVANPPSELARLRNATLAAPENVTVATGSVHPVAMGPAATAADVELSIALPAAGAVSVGLRVLASGADPKSGVTLVVTVGPPVAPAGTDTMPMRSANVSLFTGEGGAYAVGEPGGESSHTAAAGAASFDVPAGETSVRVRALIDRSIVEFFAGNGRAVFTARTYPRPGSDRITVSSSTGASVSVAVYEMGCGWA